MRASLAAMLPDSSAILLARALGKNDIVAVAIVAVFGCIDVSIITEEGLHAFQ